MKIGLIGLGVVGGTLERWFRENTKHELALYDPPKGLVDSLKGCEAIFISVPVPSGAGGQDLTILRQVVARAKQYTPNVFIRSTVLPETNDDLGTISMPEFLTERTAYENFCELPIIVGQGISEQQLRVIFPGKETYRLTNIECELAKFAHNCFGALKVTYFNVIEELSRKLGARFDAVKFGASITGFIEMEHHTQVPGPDGLRGYGGKCFPENIRALKLFLASPELDMVPAALLFQSLHSLNLVHRGNSVKSVVAESMGI